MKPLVHSNNSVKNGEERAVIAGWVRGTAGWKADVLTLDGTEERSVSAEISEAVGKVGGVPRVWKVAKRRANLWGLAAMASGREG